MVNAKMQFREWKGPQGKARVPLVRETLNGLLLSYGPSVEPCKGPGLGNMSGNKMVNAC